MDKPGFKIVHRQYASGDIHGFRMFFDNGYGISVIFGDLTDSNDIEYSEFDSGKEFYSPNAEVAVINDKGEVVPFPKNTIKSSTKPEDLPQIISWVMNR